MRMSITKYRARASGANGISRPNETDARQNNIVPFANAKQTHGQEQRFRAGAYCGQVFNGNKKVLRKGFLERGGDIPSA
jgi:hypothetical protein